MPRVRKRIRDTEKKEIEPVLTSVSPEDAINLHKTNDIRHILETLIGESVSKTLISDIFNMLFLCMTLTLHPSHKLVKPLP